MTMFHEDSAGEEAPFGVVTFSGDAAARLPARGSAIVDAQVCTAETKSGFQPEARLALPSFPWAVLCSAHLY